MKNKKLLAEYFAWGKAEVEKENQVLKEYYNDQVKSYELRKEFDKKDREEKESRKKKEKQRAKRRSELEYKIADTFFWEVEKRKELQAKLDKIPYDPISFLDTISNYAFDLTLLRIDFYPTLETKEFQPTKEGFYKWLSDNDKLQNDEDILENQDFYDLMQLYRYAKDDGNARKRFEDVKEFIRNI